MVLVPDCPDGFVRHRLPNHLQDRPPSNIIRPLAHGRHFSRQICPANPNVTLQELVTGHSRNQGLEMGHTRRNRVLCRVPLLQTEDDKCDLRHLLDRCYHIGSTVVLLQGVHQRTKRQESKRLFCTHDRKIPLYSQGKRRNRRSIPRTIHESKA